MEKTLPECQTCEFGYRGTLLQVMEGLGDQKTAIYDIDLVIERNGAILAIGEYKRFTADVPVYLIPLWEYIALGRLAKRLAVPAYVIVEHVRRDRESLYYVFTADKRREARRAWKGRLFALFPKEEAVAVYDEPGFQAFIASIVAGGL